MYFEIEKQAKDAIIKAIDNFDCEIDTDFKLEFPPNPDLGDLASTISFALAKQLRRAPDGIAEELASCIEVPEIFEKVKAVGPYVNFFVDYSKFSKMLLDYVTDDYGQLEKVDEKIVLEHINILLNYHYPL